MLGRILLAGLVASTLAFAQGGPGGPGGPPGGLGGTRLDRLSAALKLTKDQKKNVKAVMDDAQKEAVPVHDQLTKAHLAIAEAIAAGKSQEEIGKAIQGHAELETQMASIELHAFAKAVVGLEAEQRQAGIRLLFNMVRGAFNGKNWNLD